MRGRFAGLQSGCPQFATAVFLGLSFYLDRPEGMDDIFRGEALDALETPVTEEGRAFGYKLVFLAAAVLTFLDLIDPAVGGHNLTVRTQAATVPGPVRINDIDLSPTMAI